IALPPSHSELTGPSPLPVSHSRDWSTPHLFQSSVMEGQKSTAGMDNPTKQSRRAIIPKSVIVRPPNSLGSSLSSQLVQPFFHAVGSSSTIASPYLSFRCSSLDGIP